MPQIIIIHYHLNPGGVTRIIESQIQCIRESLPHWGVKVLSGDAADKKKIESLGATLVINPDLNYLTDPEIDLQAKLTQIELFLRSQISRDDILHFHNMNLGKNPLLTIAVSKLSAEGQAVVNHAHDFSEDRPANQHFLQDIIQHKLGENLQEVMYPNRNNHAYATLNSFDRMRLTDCGLSDERVYLLPNPVVIEVADSGKNKTQLKAEMTKDLGLDPKKLLITYPVRVIRRKNIGEFILLCELLKDKASWVVTQPPKNPEEIVFYKEWKTFCEKEDIPVVFEAGLSVDFLELVQASDWCFTTSIREGFGMVFMEPWLLGTPVAGRNLDYITADLEASGMKFPLLYHDIMVNRDNNLIDFPELEMKEQFEFIRNLKSQPELRKEVFKQNPGISELTKPVKENIIKNNQSTILTDYSLKSYAKRIERIYKQLAG